MTRAILGVSEADAEGMSESVFGEDETSAHLALSPTSVDTFMSSS